MQLHREILGEDRWIIEGNNFPVQIAVKSFKSKIGREHLHKTMHEYFLVLMGCLEIEIDSNIVKITEGDLLIVEPSEKHRIVSKSKDSHYLLLMPKAVEGDKVDF